jgi:cytochrome c-type biogenesis protein CcmH/NrfG
MKTAAFSVLTIGASFLFGCNGGSQATVKDPTGANVLTEDGEAISKAAATRFEAGLKSLIAHDKANDWNDALCKQTAQSFLDADDKQEGTFYRALYNAGVAYQRCKMTAEAKEQFAEILGKKSDFHRARVQLGLYKYEETQDIEGAISEMRQAIKDAEFKNEEALVNLAILQMKRDSGTGEDNCDSDFDCAKLNLQRALAINDGFMPAYNQLAVYYLEAAKKKAGRKKGAFSVAAGAKKKVETQALEMAALVVSQALRKNPNYAPLFNTSGLISAELGDLSAGARAFGTARKLDPKFFEAQMNYAAVNLQFRGFKQSEQAYRAALRLRPNDFEANLGLALAVRGQINDSNFDKNVKEAEALLAKAKGIDSSRPETYYNEAILVQEFKARSGGSKAEPMLAKAKNLFNDFIGKASGKDEFDDAVKRAKERMEEIDQIIDFNKQTKKEQAIMEAERRRQEAEALKKKKGGK